jgi:hypothetical protein
MLTKLNYAKAKFLLGLAITSVYWPLSTIFAATQVRTEDEQGKSVIMFITLAALQLVRDRYEKSGAAKREEA